MQLSGAPARHVTNPAPRAREKLTFESWEEVEAILAQIGEWGPVVIFATATGLRPGEWVALERSAIDCKAKQPAVNVTASGLNSVCGRARSKSGARNHAPRQELGVA